MKTALIVTVILAIAALIAMAVFAERWRIARQALSRKDRELSDATASLKKTEALYRETAQMRDRLADSSDELRNRFEKVSKLAYYDSNTDLPNRQQLAESFAEAMAKRSEGEEVGLAMFEFRDEDAREVTLMGRNNAEMRQEIVQRFRSSMNEEDDTLACVSEDAFAVLTRRIAHRRDYAGKIDKLFKLLSLPVMNNGAEMMPRVFGAIVIAPEGGDSMQLLDMNLGIAMEEAMSASVSGYRFYNPEMAAVAMNKMAQQAMVTESVRAGLIEYPVTPRVRLANNRAEQLVITPMLTTAEGRMVGRELMQRIDDSGLAMVVYREMLHRACEDLQRYSEMGVANVRCVIPVTDRVFANREFIKTTYDVLQTIQLDMRRVIFEVSEKAVAKNLAESTERMRKLSNFGVRFVLETGGLPLIPTGELQRMPFDAWLLTSWIPEDYSEEEARELLSVVTQTAHRMEADVILTDIAAQETADLAAACGVDCVQGGLYGDAMSGELAGRLLTALQ